jgi:hypothetical protein
MGDDIRFHDAVAAIVRFGQCVRVGCNVGPKILNLGSLTVDYFLVIVDECVALPMRGAPQLATGISWRLEAGEKPIALRIRIPPDRDEPTQVSPDRANGMALGNQCGPPASQPHVRGAAPACAFRYGLTVLHDLHRVPVPRQRLGKPGHLRDSSGVDGLGPSG